MKRHGLTDNKELPSCGRRKFLQASTSLPLAIPTAITQTLNPQSRPPKAKSVVLLWLWGAPSHIDTWDPKPDAPTDFRGPFSTIATRTTGIHFSELLPHLSERTNLFSLVRSNRTFHSGHLQAGTIGLTGAAENGGQIEPHFGSILARHQGYAQLPPFISIGRGSPRDVVGQVKGYGGGKWGRAYDPFMIRCSEFGEVDVPSLDLIKGLTRNRLSNRQTLLFSATLDGDIAKLTRDYQSDPIRHEVGEETPDITAATHLFWTVDKTARVGLTAKAVTAAWPAIIFCRTRHGADRLAKQLSRSEVKTAAIHGGRSQSQRTRALADFSIGRVHALVATDVAARGIHVDGVASVVHYDPPEDHKAYIHRSGRTARAGEGGVVISLVQPDQKKGARRLQRDIGLDEPVTDPDLAVVRDLTQPAARQLSPALSQEGPEGQSDTRTNDRAPDFHPRRNRSHGKRRHGTGKGGSKRVGSSQGGNSRNDNRQGGPKRNGKPGQRGNKPAAARRSGPKRSGSSQGGNSRNDNRQGGPKRNGKPGSQRRNGNGGGQHRSRNAGGQRRSAG